MVKVILLHQKPQKVFRRLVRPISQRMCMYFIWVYEPNTIDLSFTFLNLHSAYKKGHNENNKCNELNKLIYMQTMDSKTYRQQQLMRVLSIASKWNNWQSSENSIWILSSLQQYSCATSSTIHFFPERALSRSCTNYAKHTYVLEVRPTPLW